MTDALLHQAHFNTKEGWLAKTGSNNKGWRERYFILSNGKLSYFKSEKDDNPQGFIDLQEVHEMTKAPGRKGFGFDLLVSGRIYNMSAKSELEQDEWMAAVRESLETVRKIYGPPVDSIPSSGSISSIRKASGSVSGGFLGKKKGRLESVSSVDQESETHELQRSISPPSSSSMHSQQTNRKSDTVLNSLLEVEVDALRSKVSQLEEDLELAQSRKKILQMKLEENRVKHEENIKQMNNELVILRTRIGSLEKAKSHLEAVNDSLVVQVQDKEDAIAQMTDDVKDLEEEVKHYQEEASRTKERLDEVEEVFEALQKKMIQEKESFNRLEKERDELKETLDSEKEQRQTAEDHLRQSIEVWQRLEAAENERDHLKALINLQNQRNEVKSPVDENELKEEKLQLQLELENLKSSNIEELGTIRETHDKEKKKLLSQLEQSQQQETRLNQIIKEKNQEIEEFQHKMVELSEQLRTTEERRKQLQIEKEKAVSDLITMRKSIKEKERNAVVDDESPVVRPKQGQSSSPTLTAKLSEAENRAEMATRLLQEIQMERDVLKAQLNKMQSSSQSNGGHSISERNRESVDDLTPPPPFLIKSQPITGISSPVIPPTKPKRPPRELLNNLLSSN